MVSRSDIKGIVFLICFAMLSALIFNHLSPFGIALFGQWEKNKGVVSALSKQNPIDYSIEIHQPDLVLQVVEQKKRVILDARHQEFYDAGHIPGAVSWPLAQVQDARDKFVSTVKEKSTPILVYCSGFDCTDSHYLAAMLMKNGFLDVKVFPGGWQQWVDMGFEVEKNENGL